MAVYAARIGRHIVLHKGRRAVPVEDEEPPAQTPAVLIAVASEARVAEIVARWFEVTATSIPEAELAQALESGRAAQVLEVMNIEGRLTEVYHGSGLDVQESSLQEAFSDLFRRAAYAEMQKLENGIAEVQKESSKYGTAFEFDVLNPLAVDWLRDQGGRLIREISEDTRRGVIDVVIRGFKEGKHPYEQAREIRGIIGLTERQARAVGNYQRALYGEGPQLREALQRALRDRRFDSTLERLIDEGGLLPHAQAEKMVQRYYERYKQYRAKMIARTETLRASNAGQQMLWEQNASKGVLPEERTRRHWITAPGACPICLQVPKMNVDGVKLNENFRTELGEITLPPLHPHCRCGVGLQFTRTTTAAQDLHDYLGGITGVGASMLQPAVPTIKERMASYRKAGAAIREKLTRRVSRLSRAELLAAQRLDKLAQSMAAAETANQPLTDLLPLASKAEDAFWALRHKKQALYSFVADIGKRDGVQITALPMGNLEKYAVANAREAASFVQTTVRADKGIKGLNVFVRGIAEDGRAWSDPGTRQIFVTANDNIAIHVHELGHVIEENIEEIGAVAKQFLADRTEGEVAVSLTSLTGKSGFGADEVAKKDKFIDPYIGKQYKDGYTEVTSMTLQFLYEDWQKFADADSDMFDLMVGLLTGGAK